MVVDHVNNYHHTFQKLFQKSIKPVAKPDAECVANPGECPDVRDVAILFDVVQCVHYYAARLGKLSPAHARLCAKLEQLGP